MRYLVQPRGSGKRWVFRMLIPPDFFCLPNPWNGNSSGAECLRRAGKGGVALRATVSANAKAFAADLAPVLADIRSAGHFSLRTIAADPSRRGIGTRRGGQWGGA